MRKFFTNVGITLFGFIFLLTLASCTNNPSYLNPPQSPTPPVQIIKIEPIPHEIPSELQIVFNLRCSKCHGEDGHSGKGGSIYKSKRLTAKEWEVFLKNPRKIRTDSKMPAITGLTNNEYKVFGEWLAKVTKHNKY